MRNRGRSSNLPLDGGLTGWNSRGGAGLWLACLLIWIAVTPGVLLAAGQEADPPAPEVVEAEAQASEDAAAEPSAAEASESAVPEVAAPEPVEEFDTAPTPEAEPAEEPRRSGRRSRSQRVDKDTQIHLMSDLEIDQGEVSRDAVVVMGSLHVDGKVLGDAVAVMGPVFIEGEVTGSVTAIGNDVHLGGEAEVMGDVISVGGSVEIESGARVLGEVSEISIGPAMHVGHVPWILDSGDWNFQGIAPLGVAWGVFWTVFRWILLILVTSFVFLVARGAVESTAEKVSDEPFKAGLLGLAAWLLFFPLMVVATIVLALSIIGIPLLIVFWPLALFALVIACLVGYTSTTYAIGRYLCRRFSWSPGSPYVMLLIGVVTIQFFSLIADILGGMGGFLWFFALMFAFVGWLVRFSVWTAGLGATIMAYTERRRERQMPPAQPPLAEPPVPAAPPAPAAPAAPTAPDQVLEPPSGGEPGGVSEDRD